MKVRKSQGSLVHVGAPEPWNFRFCALKGRRPWGVQEDGERSWETVSRHLVQVSRQSYLTLWDPMDQ